VKTLLTVAAFAAFATAAMAQPDADADAGSSNSQTRAGRTNEKGEPLVCRWVSEADVGSLIRGRTRRCLTAEQWRAQRR
jgi:hypothetical protein